MKVFILLSHFVPTQDRASWETDIYDVFDTLEKAEKQLKECENTILSESGEKYFEFEIVEKEVK